MRKSCVDLDAGYRVLSLLALLDDADPIYDDIGPAALNCAHDRGEVIDANVFEGASWIEEGLAGRASKEATQGDEGVELA